MCKSTIILCLVWCACISCMCVCMWDLICATVVAAAIGNKQLSSDFTFDRKRKGKGSVWVCALRYQEMLLLITIDSGIPRVPRTLTNLAICTRIRARTHTHTYELGTWYCTRVIIIAMLFRLYIFFNVFLYFVPRFALDNFWWAHGSRISYDHSKR